MVTEREIELALGVWLAHAPFRVAKKKQIIRPF